ncbi:MAG: DUF4058 family protein [Anaerolineae bacterium]|uniref:DUF4058 family protein n=1 Tax=Thermoflexus sp. TaxID=1969742 RepID=UPI0025D93CAA|nr:DUF4058 family protein [Thermoflexus sp.]MCS7351734.1 DUF4058 family protein [Thermoflexus sp.]MDW8181192.1 DUF4058 family protein [Anaerolineae bacterium]
MPSPFPGMDPYLEHPALWPDVHNSLIAALRDELAPRLRPRYIVAIEERIYRITQEGSGWSGRADVVVTRVQATVPEAGRSAPQLGARVVEVPLPETVRETYLEVRAVGTGEVVTVVEILSPTNKRPGEARRLYEQKRMLILGSQTHLVEIDLLRAGEPMPVVGDGRDGHYRILVSRWEQRPRALLYVFTVRDPIPVFRLPLQAGDEEPEVDLGRLLQTIYDRAAYDLRVNYEEEPVPPLEPPFAEWANARLREQGARRVR